MIKYIKDYSGTTGKEQYKKMMEELLEAKVEYEFENKENEIQELCDLIQTVFTRFNRLGMRLEDISQAMTKHYAKETLRGRVVVEIEGQDYKDKIIEQLLVKIANLERDLSKTYNFNGNTEVLKELGIDFNVKLMEEDRDRKARYKTYEV